MRAGPPRPFGPSRAELGRPGPVAPTPGPDRLQAQAHQRFGHLPPGYARPEAICRWVHPHVRSVPGSSTGSTSALDTLGRQQGVCRDVAHLMIELPRRDTGPLSTDG